MPPTPQVLTAQSIYSARAPTYDSSWHPLLASQFIAHASLTPAQSVLDLAAGTGLLALPAQNLVGPTGTVVAVDITASMMDVGRQKACSQGIEGIQWIEHDIADLSSCSALEGRKGTFDIVFCCSALVLLLDPDAAVRSWAEYLKEGGKMIIDVPTPKSGRQYQIMEVVNRELGAELAFNRRWVRDEESLPEVMRGAGLHVERSWESESYVDETVLGRGMAGSVFERLAGSNGMWGDVEMWKGGREAARRRFVEVWEGVADEEEGGKGVRELHRLYIAIGVKRR